MKIYFIVIIVVLVVVIMLLFFLLYKIYLLHVKANDEVLEEEERPLKDEVEDEKDAGADLWPTKFEDKQPVDQMDGKSLAPDKGEKVLTTVQPSIQVIFLYTFLSSFPLQLWKKVEKILSFQCVLRFISSLPYSVLP